MLTGVMSVTYRRTAGTVEGVAVESVFAYRRATGGVSVFAATATHSDEFAEPFVCAGAETLPLTLVDPPRREWSESPRSVVTLSPSCFTIRVHGSSPTGIRIVPW